MIFTKTHLAGAFVIEMDKKTDSRGFFARVFCRNENHAHTLTTDIVQVNNSFNPKKGTLRGMHYQLPPAEEVKMVRCISGALYDIILDLRPDSETFGESFGIELTAENRQMLYVPQGFAHGIITLEENTELLYFVNNYYTPSEERGLRFDDPKFNLQWPMAYREISEKDRSWPDFDPAYHGIERLRNIR